MFSVCCLYSALYFLLCACCLACCVSFLLEAVCWGVNCSQTAAGLHFSLYHTTHSPAPFWPRPRLGGGPLTVCPPRHSALMWRPAPHDSTPTRGDPRRFTIPTSLHTHTHTHPFFSFCWRLSVGVSTAPGLLRASTLFFLSHHTHSPAPFWPPPSPGRWSSDGLPAAPSCAHVAGSATRFHSHTGRPSKVHHPHLPPHTHTHPFFSSCWRLSVGVSTAPGLPPAFFFIFTASPSPTITFSSHPVVNGDCPWPSHPHIQRGRRPSAPGSLRTNSIAFLFGSFSGVLGSKRLHAPSLHACKLPDVTRP